jgi:amidase
VSATALWRLSVAEATAGLDKGDFSSLELVDACLKRIEDEDGGLRAFVTLAAERARAEARASDARRRAGGPPRPLEGAPFAVKDVTATAGVRTTFGSLVYRDNIPAADELCVARLRAAGAILIGKTNTPEFGFGPRCVNFLAGPTANPYDLRLSSGGSSGGSAAAVAAGLVPFAQGTDFGGSLRTPASFCGVVGFRPTPGLIPAPGKPVAWNALSTSGAIARDVADAAQMLTVMAGFDPRDPLSHPGDAVGFAPLPHEPRVAVTDDLGVAPISSAVRDAFARAARRLAGLYKVVDAAAPDCVGAPDAFATLRAALVHRQFAPLVAERRNELTAPLVWNAERGARLTAEAWLAAEERRSKLFADFSAFFERYDFLVTPAAAVLPFSNQQEDVWDIDGAPLATPIDYLTITFLISLIGWPSLSLPAGFTESGVPFGIQIVAPPHADGRLLSFAQSLERALDFRHAWPTRD